MTSASTITRSAFYRNSASSNGGAIYLHSSTATLTVSDSLFEDNRGGLGGAVDPRNLDVDGTWFIGNSGAHGGAAYTPGTTTVTNSYWCGNTAARSYSGGALYAGKVTTSNTVWARNDATNGGAIYVVGGSGGLSAANDTFAANTATTGGAVYLQACNVYPAAFLNDIFAYTGGGDAIYAASGTCSSSTTYTDFYDNRAADAGGSYSFTAGGFGNLAVDPLFVSYSGAGDCYTDSYALLAGSPMIDAGTASLYDVDGTR